MMRKVYFCLTQFGDLQLEKQHGIQVDPWRNLELPQVRTTCSQSTNLTPAHQANVNANGGQQSAQRLTQLAPLSMRWLTPDGDSQ
jgi:hypothetical protein